MDVISMALIHAMILCNISSIFGNTAHISYIGCFYDAYTDIPYQDPVRVLPNGQLRLQTGMRMTIGTCIKFCTEQTLQMQYAGVESGYECWCGAAEAPYDINGQRDDSECMTRECSGNPRQYCGNDFKIAVYNLTLVRCQLPNTPGLDTSNPDFIPVYDTATFTCLPGYQLSGPDSVQCIFDDDITDTRWSSGLPQCLSIPDAISSASTPTRDVQPRLTTSTITSIQEEFTNPASESNQGLVIGTTIGAVVLVLALMVIAITRVVVIHKRMNSESTSCSIDKSHRDMKNQDQEDPDVAQIASDDKTYVDLNKSTMQESTYQGLVSLQDSAYQGLVNPQMSTYQGLIKPQAPRSSEVYADVEPREDQNKAHDTDQSEYENVPDANAGSTNTSYKGQVPIPPPVEHDEITDDPGDYVNVKNR